MYHGFWWNSEWMWMCHIWKSLVIEWLFSHLFAPSTISFSLLFFYWMWRLSLFWTCIVNVHESNWKGHGYGAATDIATVLWTHPHHHGVAVMVEKVFYKRKFKHSDNYCFSTQSHTSESCESVSENFIGKGFPKNGNDLNWRCLSWIKWIKLSEVSLKYRLGTLIDVVVRWILRAINCSSAAVAETSPFTIYWKIWAEASIELYACREESIKNGKRASVAAATDQAGQLARMVSSPFHSPVFQRFEFTFTFLNIIYEHHKTFECKYENLAHTSAPRENSMQLLLNWSKFDFDSDTLG